MQFWQLINSPSSDNIGISREEEANKDTKWVASNFDGIINFAINNSLSCLTPYYILNADALGHSKIKPHLSPTNNAKWGYSNRQTQIYSNTHIG